MPVTLPPWSPGKQNDRHLLTFIAAFLALLAGTGDSRFVLGSGSVLSQALLTLQAALLKKKGTFIGEVNLTLRDQAMQEGSPSMALGLSLHHP